MMLQNFIFLTCSLVRACINHGYAIFRRSKNAFPLHKTISENYSISEFLMSHFLLYKLFFLKKRLKHYEFFGKAKT